MKKIFTLFAVAVMALAAQAETLTVFDNEDYLRSNYCNAPFNFMYIQQYTGNPSRCQVLYHATDIQALNGKTITSMTFYTGENGIYHDGGLISISLGETDVEEMTGYIEGLTVVCTMSIEGHLGEETEVTINFTTPYEYKGGNLVFESIAIETCNTLAFGNTNFKGYYAPNWYGYFSVWYYKLSTGYGTDWFLPMTTFTYEESTTPPTPSEKTADPSISADTRMGIHAYFVTVTESEPSDLYYRYQKDNGEWTEWTLYDGTVSFEEDGYYKVEAYAKAQDKAESNTVSVSFVVSPRTGLDELSGDKAVAGVRYFNAMGQEMAQPAGLTIVVTTYSDGTVSTMKVMR